MPLPGLRLMAGDAQPLERRVVVVGHDRDVPLRRRDRVVRVRQMDLRPVPLDPCGALRQRRRRIDADEAEQRPKALGRIRVGAPDLQRDVVDHVPGGRSGFEAPTDSVGADDARPLGPL